VLYIFDFRFDEVSILESNLKELQIEYQRCEEERKLESSASANLEHSIPSHYSDNLNPFNSRN
jgi:hypothetical protein